MLRVEIEWLDSGTMLANDTWTKTTEVMQKAQVGSVITVGQLLQLNEEVAVVGLSFDQEYDNWFGVQAIARENIRRITVLRSRKDYSPDMFDTLPSSVV